MTAEDLAHRYSASVLREALGIRLRLDDGSEARRYLAAEERARAIAERHGLSHLSTVDWWQRGDHVRGWAARTATGEPVVWGPGGEVGIAVWCSQLGPGPALECRPAGCRRWRPPSPGERRRIREWRVVGAQEGQRD